MPMEAQRPARGQPEAGIDPVRDAARARLGQALLQQHACI